MSNTTGLTADEVAAIADRMYCKYMWQMNPIGLDFDEMSHGNNDLAQDLRVLHGSGGYKQAMDVFDGLWKKWNLYTSKVVTEAGST